MLGMNWEPTDQFGNLFKATSHASNGPDLIAALKSMIEEVVARGATEGEFAVDVEFGEIAAPSEYQVTHILCVPQFANRIEEKGEPADLVQTELMQAVKDALDQSNAGNFRIRGPF